MKQSIFAAILLLASTPWAQGSPTTTATAPPGTALIIASDSAGGLFAPGDSARYRVLNASSSVALGPIKASISRGQGFTVINNSCSAGLDPGRSCIVLVRWNAPTDHAPLSRAQLVISSQAPSIEVRNALTGDRSLSAR